MTCFNALTELHATNATCKASDGSEFHWIQKTKVTCKNYDTAIKQELETKTAHDHETTHHHHHQIEWNATHKQTRLIWSKNRCAETPCSCFNPTPCNKRNLQRIRWILNCMKSEKKKEEHKKCTREWVARFVRVWHTTALHPKEINKKNK